MSVVLVLLAILGCASLGRGIRHHINSIPNLRFIVEPSRTYVAEGQSLTLFCRATCNCTGPIRYSWTKNERNISTTVARVSDQHSGNFVVAKFSEHENAGSYACFAEAADVTIRTLETVVSAARLTSAKVVVSQRQFPVGGIVVLHCTSDSVPTVKGHSINWYQDNKLLVLGSKVSVLSSGELVVKDAASSNQGNYKCVVSNDVLGSAVTSNSVPISIVRLQGNTKQESPVFEVPLANQTVLFKERTTITCIARGIPTPQLKLFKGDAFYKAVFVEVASGKGMIVHSLSQASVRDDGRYRCVAASGSTKVASDGKLTVLVPPYIKDSHGFPAKDRLVRPQEGEATLKCTAGGIPRPKVNWYVNGKRITTDSRLRPDSNGNLRITSTKPSDSGIYQCFVSNIAGSTKHAILFFVRSEGSPLQAPQNVTGTATSPSTIDVSWDPPRLNGDDEIVAYTVLWKDNQTGKVRSLVVDAQLNRCSIVGLFGGTVYEVFVQSYAHKRSGRASKVIFIRTPEGVPKIAPSHVRIRNEGNGKLEVKWSGIARGFSNGHIREYIIYYGKVGSYGKRRLHVPGTEHRAVIEGLREGDLYTIEVAGVTSMGSGPASKMVSIKVADPNETDLDKPALHWKWVNKTAVNVTWNLPISSVQVTGFRMIYINVCSKKYFDDVKIKLFAAAVHQYVISGLKRTNLYRLELRVLSGEIQGRAAHAVLHGIVNNTPRPPLDPTKIDLSEPKELKCDTKDSQSIFLSWSKPTVDVALSDYTAYTSKGCTSKPTAIRTKSREHLFKQLTPGNWYYFKVTANKVKSNGIVGFSSQYIACKTFEKQPSAPRNVTWNVSFRSEVVILSWQPPLNPNGLVRRYRIRCGFRNSGTTKWLTTWVNLATMDRKLRSPSIRASLDLHRGLYSYEVEVAAENEAGIGEYQRIIIPKGGKRHAITPVSPGTSDNLSTVPPDLDDQTRLGIIIGCSIAIVFVLILIIVFIWKNPFRLKSAAKRGSACGGQGNAATYLYLQRMHEGTATYGVGNGHYSHTYLRSSERSEMNGYVASDVITENGAPGGRVNVRQPNTLEVTGSSSGPPICTCVCFQHGRNIHHGHPVDRVNQVSRATSTRDDDLPIEGGSTASEERESAESADSRTQMLPTREKEKRNGVSDHKTTTRDYLHKVQETTFHV